MSTVAEKKAVTEKDAVVEQMADYCQWVSYDKLPPQVVHEVKRRIIDSLGCSMGAFLSDPAKIARSVAHTAESPHYGATLIGTYHTSSPEMAAFANGLLMRYLDYNDTYLSLEPAHPSDNIAAVFALAEPEGATGKEIITAIALAYEIQCRLCDAASIRANGWDHVTYGAYSAVLGAAKILKLNEKETRQAIALSGVPNVAMRQARVGMLSHWKGAAFANASRNAVFAARLAWHGMTGPSHIFDGEMGFKNQCSGPFELADMGGTGKNKDDYMINRTYIKFWPAEYHSQSAIDAALQLRPAIGDVSKIKAIDIDSFDAAVDIIGGEEEKWFPTSRETADHSMPYCVAAALVDGDIWMDQFDEAHLANPVIKSLIQKIKMHRDAELTAGYPKGIPNRLRVTMDDGTVHEKLVSYPRGHAENPMTDEEVVDKFMRLASPMLSDGQIKFVLPKLWNLENETDLSIILEAFCV
ncbi:MAG: MmgE/PrpD family protein [Cyanobacteria bacterium HKST-UBA03]|nr:MmgE/PrpD family protein [Cyanobacteria bacterium HKST-UBA03]